MDLNNCLKSSVYILRVQVWDFVAICPCNASLRLQRESHASCLLSIGAHVMDAVHSHACHEGEAGGGGVVCRGYDELTFTTAKNLG